MKENTYGLNNNALPMTYMAGGEESSKAAREIIDDTESGSFELLERTVELLSEIPEEEVDGFLSAVLRWRYSMTPLVNLANRAYISMENGKDPVDGAQDHLETAVERRKKVVKRGGELLTREGHGRVATISYSSTVVEVLEDVWGAVVFESRPGMEGRKTAEILLEAGLDVDLYVDAAMMEALEKVDAVLVGADTVAHEGFLNKVGTAPLAAVSRERGLPFYVAADQSKFLPPDVPVPVGEEHPPGEVWKTDTAVDVHNDYFEFTPWKDARIMTAEGVKKGADLELEDRYVSERLLQEHPLASTDDY